ncbi:Probable inactive tRNA-specific adenosine deaminase-like protein 3 [Eumeta japonica]|uniref:Probable inactive tRNA-specific adenosine deaminase-like protein 3 n=1 Tax=Eumeta variegata TaxID=151549 RepID=A0A4C1W0F6_EUMVA|nr:Probable inactive tRNA-specific adenosine deaminase-like protein 3 [Eumeta japonica]
MEVTLRTIKFHVERNSDIVNSNVAIVVDPSIQSIVAIALDNRNIHPIQHAAMLAIDNVAKTQNGGAWVDHDEKREITLRGIDNKVYEYLKNQYPDLKYGSKPFRSKKDMSDDEVIEITDCGPYLCTGYYIYLLREPCIMCSMALVHARVKRVFYCFKNKDSGGLETKVKLQTISSLNHHFEVFTGFICP